MEAWVRSWYQHWHSLSIELPKIDETTAPMAGHQISITEYVSPAGESAWRMDWDYPDPTDPTMRLEVDCSIATSGDSLEFGLGVSRESAEFRLAPSPFEIKPPYLVRQLVRDYLCRAGRRELYSEPRVVDADAVPEFVKNEIVALDRTLPVVLVTRPNLGERFLADPSLLASLLSGIGFVFVLTDRTATYALTDALGAELSCYNGACRIYWPGFTTEDPRLRHTLFLPDTITRIIAEGKGIEDTILLRVAAVSALRFGLQPEASRIRRDALDKEESRIETELSELRGRLVKEGTGRDALLDRLHALELLDRERSKRIRTLEAENVRLKSAGERTPVYVSPVDEPGGKGPHRSGAQEPDISSVSEAISRGRTDFSDYLLILRSATESAARSYSRHTREVYRALEAIREVAYDYFLGLDTKTGMGETMERAFRRRGFKFKLKDSITTTGKYGGQRTFVHDGVPTLFEMHLTIGGGDRQDPVQIYFLPDLVKRRFVIGYCGMHLDIVEGAS